MKKEHFKNLVLIVLIITNFMLSQGIFANKKLWLFGYNFFANMGNNQEKDDFSTALHITVPEKIYVNTGYQSSRFCFSRGSAQFNTIYEKAEKLISSAFSASVKNITEISQEAWYSVLSGKSMYLSFSGEYSPQIYAELIGISQTNLSFDTFSHIAINEDGNVFIMDNANSAFYRILLSDSSVKPLIEQIMNDNRDTESIINYSYELNFDKDFGDQKTFISPMVPVYSSPVYTHTVFVENPVMRSEEMNSGIIERILSAFSINPNTVRRYTEADGTLVFVENNGVLKITTDGVLNFTTNDTGIELSGGNMAILSLSQFTDKINSASGSQKELTLTSPIGSETNSYTFDYLISGIPVKFNDKSAVSAKIEDGFLKEYTHILRKFSPSSPEIPMQPFIEALDNTIVYYQDSMKEIHIMEMFPAYVCDISDHELIKDWYIEINDVIAE